MADDKAAGSAGVAKEADKEPNPFAAPSVSLPKGGGAIKGIGEKFGVNPVNGTGTLSVPVFTTPGRSKFFPNLSLSYDSGAGNGPFGYGWCLSVPNITRKTDKGLPRYLTRRNQMCSFSPKRKISCPHCYRKGKNGERIPW
jgi:hypothetical protein